MYQRRSDLEPCHGRPSLLWFPIHADVLGLGLFIASVVFILELCTSDNSSIQDQDHQSDEMNMVDMEFAEVDDLSETPEKYSDIESDSLAHIQLDSLIENDIDTKRGFVESSSGPDIFVVKDNSY